MDLKRLRLILDRAASKRILVIGDLMLDEFVWGKVGRISPEAPVPVVEVTGESFFPGGAANVARNLRELIDRVSVIGLTGIDWSGMTAVKPNRAEAFLAAGIPSRDLEISPKKDVDLVHAGKELLQKWSVQYLLVTLGEHGMMFFEKGKRPHHIPTKARDVFD